MLARAITGRLTIGVAIITILGIGARYAVKIHHRNEERDQAAMDRLLPALHQLSPENLVSSDWSYDGPLGKLTLHFNTDGKLAVTSGDQTSTGRWEIQDIMLKLYLQDSESPHQGVFRTSIDEISGPSPKGLEPGFWTAVRIK